MIRTGVTVRKQTGRYGARKLTRLRLWRVQCGSPLRPLLRARLQPGRRGQTSKLVRGALLVRRRIPTAHQQATQKLGSRKQIFKPQIKLPISTNTRTVSSWTAQRRGAGGARLLVAESNLLLPLPPERQRLEVCRRRADGTWRFQSYTNPTTIQHTPYAHSVYIVYQQDGVCPYTISWDTAAHLVARAASSTLTRQSPRASRPSLVIREMSFSPPLATLGYPTYHSTRVSDVSTV